MQVDVTQLITHQGLALAGFSAGSPQARRSFPPAGKEHIVEVAAHAGGAMPSGDVPSLRVGMVYTRMWACLAREAKCQAECSDAGEYHPKPRCRSLLCALHSDSVAVNVLFRWRRMELELAGRSCGVMRAVIPPSFGIPGVPHCSAAEPRAALPVRAVCHFLKDLPRVLLRFKSPWPTRRPESSASPMTDGKMGAR
ncbi:hypothetical protein SKAU_G00149400 [Synaphobranchus kaupii]|uniref:Uncharacterized protein n=1 Tax=Synaphobranchus kaupii TaxID=118154 RepID=A0A9Q1J422_SYNKA|nr:hypothetical protein SKAU_G00149400 [Synaphobranchus kaupii]